MRLPPTAPPALEFINAPGSAVPREFAVEARKNPDAIEHMAETQQEKRELRSEALARQYVILVDRSGSMGASDGVGTRWDSARTAVESMVETIFRYDIDHSVPLYVFDDAVEFIGELTSPSQVLKVFQSYRPRGCTDLAKALKEALGTWAGTRRPNYATVPGTTFIVLLDGGADDESAVMSTLRHFAEPTNGYIQNHTQLAISLVQIGDDPQAARFLKRLDDEIIPDICDTKKDDILREHGGIDRLLHDAIFD